MKNNFARAKTFVRRHMNECFIARKGEVEYLVRVIGFSYGFIECLVLDTDSALLNRLCGGGLCKNLFLLDQLRVR